MVNWMRILGAIAVPILTIIFAALVPLSAGRAADLFSPPVTTTMSMPFSDTLATDKEDISVSGLLHIEAYVTLTPTTIFGKVHTNISDTTGIGMTSGQMFLGVGASSQHCALPAGLRSSSSPTSLQLTPQYRLSPSAPLSPLYEQFQEGSLPLILQLTFRRDGTLVGVSVVVGTSRFSAIPTGFA